MATFTATYKGKNFTRTSKTVTYTHVTLIRMNGEIVDARWSKSLQGALAKLPNGWESERVAVVEVTAEAPAAKTFPILVLLENGTSRTLKIKAADRMAAREVARKRKNVVSAVFTTA